MNLRPCVPSELNPPVNTTLINSVSGMNDVVYFLENVNEFGLDLETNMTTSFFDRRIRTIQVGNREAQYVIDLLAFAPSRDGLIGGMGDYYRSSRSDRVGLDYVRNTLIPYLETDSKIKIGHNLSFEYETLKWNLGIRIFGLYDTMLVERVLKSGLVNFKMANYWALDDLVGRYCGLQISKDEQKSFNLIDPLTEKQIIYAGMDTRFPVAIKGAQMKSVLELGLQRTIQIENDAIPAFSDMHLNGMLIDSEKWAQELKDTEVIHKKNIEALDELFIPVVGTSERPFSEEEERLCEKFWREEKDKLQRAQYRDKFYAIRRANKKWLTQSNKYEGKAGIQYGSPAQLLPVLRKASGLKIASTNDEILEIYEGDKFVDAVREFRTTLKILTSYGEYLDKHVNPNTGRIHGIFDQLGAETGRTASRNPNLQNIDKNAVWRNCFIARPGKVILTIDYSGCELRILAEVSGEKVWIDAFNANWDVHSVGAEMIFGQRWKDAAEEGCAYYSKHKKCACKEHEILRDYIKAINFGIAYGMESGKLSRKIKITKKEAQELLIKYRKAFPNVTAWLEKAGKEAQALLRSVTLAGRIRFYPKPNWELAKQYAADDALKDGVALTQDLVNRKYKSMFSSIERQGKNSPIQGTNADMVKLSVGVKYMWKDLEPKYGALLLSSVHDECVIEADESNAQEVFDYSCKCMFDGGNEFLTVIKAEVEGHIRKYWSKK